MATELTLNAGTLLGFLLVLTRVAGVFVFVPLPGIKGGPEMARIVLAFAVSLSLFHFWPVIQPGINIAVLMGLIFSEAAVGITIGTWKGVSKSFTTSWRRRTNPGFSSRSALTTAKPFPA